MARQASPTDFVLDVEGVGKFAFGRRRMADQIKIQVEYARLIDGVTPTPWLDTVATWLSVLKVLTVRAPEGFDLEELDPLDDDTYRKIMNVYEVLRSTEVTFRGGAVKAGEGRGQEAGPVA